MSTSTQPSRLANPRWLRFWATFVLFGLIASQFWRNLLGWWGFTALAAAAVISAAVILLVRRPAFSWRRTPKAVWAFVILTFLSIIWSFYPAETALAATATLATALLAFTIALTLTWNELLKSLSSALKWVLALSLGFELLIELLGGERVLPFFFEILAAPADEYPASFYWSRALLFEGGPIQGIVGNRNLLGFAALLGMIVFAIQFWHRPPAPATAVHPATGSTAAIAAQTAAKRQITSRNVAAIWFGVAVLTATLTRSATVTLIIPIVLLTLAFVLWARQRGQARRHPVYLAMIATVALAWTAVSFVWHPLLELLGKSSDQTACWKARLPVLCPTSAKAPAVSRRNAAGTRPEVPMTAMGLFMAGILPLSGGAIRRRGRRGGGGRAPTRPGR